VHPKTFTFAQKVLFKHCDPARIVFFPRYFEMMNDCVEDFFNHIGTPFETMHRDSGVPTGRIEARFHAPSRHGDHLTLVLRGQRISRATFDFTIQTTCGDEARMSYAATLIYIDAQGKSQPWPDGLRAALTSYINNEA
jgi:4-hydroxybenzoyl-CoA thioesterase